MPVLNRIAEFAQDMKTWRHHLHQRPELKFDCHETAGFVVERLREFGITEIHEGIAQSGVVAIIDGQGDGPTIGLRADMDALPIQEVTGRDHGSTRAGKMHACGHDGHTAMLLGAAKYLAETRNFKGRAALIFQPAEEGGGGAGVMVEEGIMDRFDIHQVYALHNLPGEEFGRFTGNSGPVMAAVDEFRIDIQGRGGHAAYPHETVDPVVACLGIANAIQTIVSRNHNSSQELVVSVTQIHTGSADNIVPDTAFVGGTVRSFDKEVRKMVMRRMAEIVEGQCQSYNVTANLEFVDGYPATVNDAQKTDFAFDVARDVVGDLVTTDKEKEMGAEDFSFMLEARPGSYLFLGSGDGAHLHHPEFDFNDDIAPIGASWFARLVEQAQPR
ncbi:MAG: M20 aminoacylase family protein [Halocynthiibacter sp.]